MVNEIQSWRDPQLQGGWRFATGTIRRSPQPPLYPKEPLNVDTAASTMKRSVSGRGGALSRDFVVRVTASKGAENWQHASLLL